MDEATYEADLQKRIAAHLADAEATEEMLQAVPTAYQWSGLDRYWRKKAERDGGSEPATVFGARPSECVPGVSWRPWQAVAAMRRPGREGFLGEGRTGSDGSGVRRARTPRLIRHGSGMRPPC